MSVQEMYKAVRRGKLTEADRTWFSRWLVRYAGFRQAERDPVVPVSRDSLIAFLKVQKARGVKAWQRQQAVRAIQFYLRVVLDQAAESEALDDVRTRLGILVERESAEDRAGRAEVTEAELVGRLDENEAEVIRLARRAMRVQHYALRTEKAYAGWGIRFLRWCKVEEPTVTGMASVGPGDVKAFLTDLAVEGDVAASTQNQALSALLFLF